MTDDTSRVPKLRFPGFAGAWEQRKLGELGSTFTGLTGKTKEDFGHGDAKFVTYMNVFQNAVASLEQLDSVEIDPKQNEVKKGDVFFTTSSETPEEVGMSSVWKYNYDNVYLNSFTFGYRPNIEFDLDYLAAMLRSTTVRKKITFLAQGISRYNISKTKMMDIEVPVPSLEEQAKIGAFLSNVEQTITLHQRKLSHLRQLKKGLLQKMFPKSGEDRPEVRFPGFVDAWEQRKLRDYLVPSKEKNSALSYGKDEVLSVSGDAGVVNQIQFQGRSYAGASTKDYGVVQTGDVIYTKSPLKKNPFGIIKTNKGKAGIVSTLYAVYKPKDNTYTPFVEVYFDDDARLNNYLRPLVNKGAKNDMKVSKSGALTGLICFPGATEQRMLSEFFQQLEDLITLHQRKLSHLQQQKKALLQQMFV